MKTIIIGQAPSRSSDPSEPISGRSGKRLAFLCGCTLDEFLATFERKNLLDRWIERSGKGDGFVLPAQATLLAAAMGPELKGRRVVVLGNHVAEAFGFEKAPFYFSDHAGASFARCPHPSGVNTWWNLEENVCTAWLFWHALYAASNAETR